MTITRRITVLVHDGDTNADVVERADNMLYRGKEKGHNRVSIHPSDQPDE